MRIVIVMAVEVKMKQVLLVTGRGKVIKLMAAGSMILGAHTSPLQRNVTSVERR